MEIKLLEKELENTLENALKSITDNYPNSKVLIITYESMEKVNFLTNTRQNELKDLLINLGEKLKEDDSIIIPPIT